MVGERNEVIFVLHIFIAAQTLDTLKKTSSTVSQMKNLPIIAILTLFLVAVSVSGKAQNRDSRTRSAQAAYGYPAEFKASKKKAKKQKKAARRKAKAPLYRNEKKSPWVN
jgi:hypothetical protein